MFAKPALPTFIQIEPVGQCNLSCVMCPVHLRADGQSGSAPLFMPFERFISLLDGFPGLKELHLQGLGEPMMHPRFFDMVSHADQRGIAVGSNSNMTLLGESRAARCVTSGLRRLNISVDGAKSETYEAIRKGARFSRVIANIELLQQARRRFGGDHLHLVMTAVVMRRNLDELADLVRLAHRLDIPTLFVQHLGQEFAESSLSPAYEPFRMFVSRESLLAGDRAAIEASFSSARAVAEELGITIRLPRLEQVAAPVHRDMRRCEWPWKAAYITYHGYAVPCCMIATADRFHFGNVFEESVASVWNGEQAENFRSRLDSGRPPELCASCAVYKGVF